jgi:hypothetical protein
VQLTVAALLGRPHVTLAAIAARNQRKAVTR